MLHAATDGIRLFEIPSPFISPEESQLRTQSRNGQGKIRGGRDRAYVRKKVICFLGEGRFRGGIWFL